MKKTISASIGGRAFNIEDDAYAKLEEYLNTVKRHFSTYPDSSEIVSDMENRVAEQFESSKVAVISMKEVDSLISTMGKVEDFSDSSEEIPKETSQTIKRKLFRDPDNKIIGGVAGGIAAYFGVDSIVIRLILALIILAGGSGLLIYVVLWAIIPEAKTQTEKMQMKGEPIDLSSLDKKMRDQAAEIKERIGHKDGSVAKLVNGLGSIIRMFFKLIQKAIGIALLFFTTIAMLGATFTAANLIFNANSPYIQFPLAQINTGVEYYFIVLTTYIAALIPMLFVLLFGISLTFGKSFLTTRKTISMLGLWFAALMVSGLLWFRFGPMYYDKIKSLPEYQETSKTVDFKDFTKVDAYGIDTLRITKGDKFQITENGRQIDLDAVDIKVENNTLVISEVTDRKFCYFCLGRASTKIEIQMPKTEELSVHGWTKLEAEDLNQDTLIVDMSGSADAELTGKLNTLTLTESGYSTFTGPDLTVQNVSIKASGYSKATINAVKKLDVVASGASKITYIGTPTITKNLSGASKVLKEGEVSDSNIQDLDSGNNPLND
jgi:phage shock protein PspC (stress-responsive transcriptional regulator)